jgi:mannose-1-phosphate guanylyltransferase
MLHTLARGERPTLFLLQTSVCPTTLKRLGQAKAKPQKELPVLASKTPRTEVVLQHEEEDKKKKTKNLPVRGEGDSTANTVQPASTHTFEPNELQVRTLLFIYSSLSKMHLLF